MSNLSKNDLDLIKSIYFQKVDSLARLYDLDLSDFEEICQDLPNYLRDTRAEFLTRYNRARKYPDGLEFIVPAGLFSQSDEAAAILSGYPSYSFKLSDLRENGSLGVNCGQTSREGVAYLCRISGLTHAVSLPQETITKYIQVEALGA